MIRKTDASYGPSSENRLAEAGDPEPAGARAALESFYFALNRRDAEAMRGVWADDPLAQLNNPVGGILRGGGEAVALYEKIFAGPVTLEVTFGDVVEYLGSDHAVFAGRESGHYAVGDGETVPLEIRTTRYFRHDGERWAQYHHHGSIDDADVLAAYQKALDVGR